ncbi:hypothetical protein ACFODL_01785 [Phenylobacterium terrae]|uniref:DUF4019 domain-containing protein n=1 Tax=Phenylobacterium terrae TaxID=2665495 RepID=A0ABW4MXD3_9CAUL
MRLFAVVAAAIALAAPGVVRAQEAPAAGVAKLEAFLASLRGGQVAQGYADLFAGTVMTKKQADLEQMIALTESAVKYCGPVRDWQRMRTNQVTPAFYELVYMVRGENCPLFFRTFLYDNGAGWSVNLVFLSDSYATAKDW